MVARGVPPAAQPVRLESTPVLDSIMRIPLSCLREADTPMSCPGGKPPAQPGDTTPALGLAGVPPGPSYRPN